MVITYRCERFKIRKTTMGGRAGGTYMTVRAVERIEPNKKLTTQEQILNLPPEERVRLQYKVRVQPSFPCETETHRNRQMPLVMAPDEPSLTMNTMLKPIVDDLLTLKDGVEVQIGEHAENTIKLQAMLAMTVCDDPGKISETTNQEIEPHLALSLQLVVA